MRQPSPMSRLERPNIFDQPATRRSLCVSHCVPRAWRGPPRPLRAAYAQTHAETVPLERLASRRNGPLRQGTDLRHFHALRSEEHTSELQSLMRISYAVFCLKKKKIQ